MAQLARMQLLAVCICHAACHPGTAAPTQRCSPVTMPTLRLRSAQKLVPIMPTKMALTGSHTRTTPQLKGSTCGKGSAEDGA